MALALPKGWASMTLLRSWARCQPNGDIVRYEVRRCEATRLKLMVKFLMPLDRPSGQPYKVDHGATPGPATEKDL